MSAQENKPYLQKLAEEITGIDAFKNIMRQTVESYGNRGNQRFTASLVGGFAMLCPALSRAIVLPLLEEVEDESIFEEPSDQNFGFAAINTLFMDLSNNISSAGLGVYNHMTTGDVGIALAVACGAKVGLNILSHCLMDDIDF